MFHCEQFVLLRSCICLAQPLVEILFQKGVSCQNKGKSQRLGLWKISVRKISVERPAARSSGTCRRAARPAPTAAPRCAPILLLLLIMIIMMILLLIILLIIMQVMQICQITTPASPPFAQTREGRRLGDFWGARPPSRLFIFRGASSPRPKGGFRIPLTHDPRSQNFPTHPPLCFKYMSMICRLSPAHMAPSHVRPCPTPSPRCCSCHIIEHDIPNCDAMQDMKSLDDARRIECPSSCMLLGTEKQQTQSKRHLAKTSLSCGC